MKTVAVLLDGGFVVKRLEATKSKGIVTAKDVYDYAMRCVAPNEEELFRIYFYHCMPYEGTHMSPISNTPCDFKQTAPARHGRQLYSDLSELDYVAVRRGKLSFDGWSLSYAATQDLQQNPRPLTDKDFKPDLSQKEVDMKIGLDVAWLSGKRIVDRIILVAGDSDFVPAMKFARREGVQVVLVTMGSYNIKRDLREHADVVRDVPIRVGAHPGVSSGPTPVATAVST